MADVLALLSFALGMGGLAVVAIAAWAMGDPVRGSTRSAPQCVKCRCDVRGGADADVGPYRSRAERGS